MAWRRSIGLGDDEVVIGFFSRLVMEKGLDVFSDAIDELRGKGVPYRVLVVGDGPARDWFENRLPEAVFTGFLGGTDLARAVASMDVLFFPSVTETFGNVTLEAMACGLPVVAAAATGSESLVDDRVTGRLIRPGAIHQYADALYGYVTDAELREIADIRPGYDGERAAVLASQCYLARGYVDSGDRCGRGHHAHCRDGAGTALDHRTARRLSAG